MYVYIYVYMYIWYMRPTFSYGRLILATNALLQQHGLQELQVK